MLRSILGINGSEYSRITPALFAYFFDRIDMEQFIAHVGERKEGTRIKDIARVNGYVLKNCKLYAYAVHCARLEKKSFPKPDTFDVTEEDAIILKRLNLKHLDTKLYRSFTLKEFDATVKEMVTSSDIRNNIGKFVTKKMSFLMKSYGEHRSDIEGYLREMAIIAVYKQYPRYESYLHMVNVAKAQIHNKGQSFITSSTSKSRQRLQQNDNGSFEACHVDLATLSDVEAPVAYGLEVRERLQALATIEHKFPERTKEFLLAAAGQYHAGFSTYLSVNNDDAAETMVYEKYLAKLQMYFGVTPENTAKLFENVRNRIHRCNHVPSPT